MFSTVVEECTFERPRGNTRRAISYSKYESNTERNIKLIKVLKVHYEGFNVKVKSVRFLNDYYMNFNRSLIYIRFGKNP